MLKTWILTGVVVLGRHDRARISAHDCDLPYEYRIGRFPVTVAQFREYVEATGESPADPDSLRSPGKHDRRRGGTEA